MSNTRSILGNGVSERLSRMSTPSADPHVCDPACQAILGYAMLINMDKDYMVPVDGYKSNREKYCRYTHVTCCTTTIQMMNNSQDKSPAAMDSLSLFKTACFLFGETPCFLVPSIVKELILAAEAFFGAVEFA